MSSPALRKCIQLSINDQDIKKHVLIWFLHVYNSPYLVSSVKAAVDFHVAESNEGSREVGNTSFFI